MGPQRVFKGTYSKVTSPPKTPRERRKKFKHRKVIPQFNELFIKNDENKNNKKPASDLFNSLLHEEGTKKDEATGNVSVEVKSNKSFRKPLAVNNTDSNLTLDSVGHSFANDTFDKLLGGTGKRPVVLAPSKQACPSSSSGSSLDFTGVLYQSLLATVPLSESACGNQANNAHFRIAQIAHEKEGGKLYSVDISKNSSEGVGNIKGKNSRKKVGDINKNVNVESNCGTHCITSPQIFSSDDTSDSRDKICIKQDSVQTRSKGLGAVSNYGTHCITSPQLFSSDDTTDSRDKIVIKQDSVQTRSKGTRAVQRLPNLRRKRISKRLCKSGESHREDNDLHESLKAECNSPVDVVTLSSARNSNSNFISLFNKNLSEALKKTSGGDSPGCKHATLSPCLETSFERQRTSTDSQKQEGLQHSGRSGILTSTPASHKSRSTLDSRSSPWTDPKLEEIMSPLPKPDSLLNISNSSVFESPMFITIHTLSSKQNSGSSQSAGSKYETCSSTAKSKSTSHIASEDIIIDNQQKTIGIKVEDEEDEKENNCKAKEENGASKDQFCPVEIPSELNYTINNPNSLVPQIRIQNTDDPCLVEDKEDSKDKSTAFSSSSLYVKEFCGESSREKSVMLTRRLRRKTAMNRPSLLLVRKTRQSSRLSKGKKFFEESMTLRSQRKINGITKNESHQEDSDNMSYVLPRRILPQLYEQTGNFVTTRMRNNKQKEVSIAGRSLKRLHSVSASSAASTSMASECSLAPAKVRRRVKRKADPFVFRRADSSHDTVCSYQDNISDTRLLLLDEEGLESSRNTFDVNSSVAEVKDTLKITIEIDGDSLQVPKSKELPTVELEVEERSVILGRGRPCSMNNTRMSCLPKTKYDSIMCIEDEAVKSSVILSPVKGGKGWRRSLANVQKEKSLGRFDDVRRHTVHRISAGYRKRSGMRISTVPSHHEASKIHSLVIYEEDAEEDSSFLFTNSRIGDRASQVPADPRKHVLFLCDQVDCLSLGDCFTESRLACCKKIGEGVYGEVFMTRPKPGSLDGAAVLKIMPIEGDFEVNGEPQKKFDEILSEIIISVELSNLRKEDRKQNWTENFVNVLKSWCVEGSYHQELLHLWDIYHENKGSENDRPDIFPDSQLYIVLEFGHGGQDLESFVFLNAGQSLAIFLQIAYSLAVAEEDLEFEHRDLHWGNVLVAQTADADVDFKVSGGSYSLKTRGVKATVIDFTLSRLRTGQCVVYNNLGEDPSLFTAEGDYQFDIYRLMKKANGNDWEKFTPYTNVLWLHYLLEKITTECYYKNVKTKVHKSNLAELNKIKKHMLDYESAMDFLIRREMGEL